MAYQARWVRWARSRLLLCAALAPCAGCFTVDLDDLAKEPPARQRYLFDVKMPEPATATESKDGAGTAAGPILLVEQAHAVSPYNARPLIYRTGDNTHESDFYNEFLISPAEQISQIAREWLRHSLTFQDVIDPDSPRVADLMLTMDLTDLRGDFRDAAAPKAVLRLRASLLDVGLGIERPSVRFQKDYAADVVVPDTSPNALVRGFSQAVAELLAELTSDLRPHAVRK